MPTKVTDPALLEKLGTAPVLAEGPRVKPVDDPALLHRLNGGSDDEWIDDADLADLPKDASGNAIIPDTDERAGLPIPGTVSEAEARGEAQTGVVPPSRSFGLSQSDTINPLPAAAALGDTMFGNIPIVGNRLRHWRDEANANIYGGTPEEARADINKTVEANPTPAAIGEGLGKASPYLAAAAVGGPLAGALGLEGTLLGRIIWGTASNEAIKVGDKLSKGEKPMDAIVNATRESLLEAPFFAFGTKTGRQSTIANAPKTAKLFEEGDKLYKAVEDSKLLISQPVSDNFINSATAKAMSEGLDETLTPATVAAVKRLQGMSGRNMSIQDAMLVRKLLGAAAEGTEEKFKNDRRIARLLINDFDDFLAGVASKGPNGEPNMAVLGGDADLAKSKLDEANKVWSAASKAKVIDTAIADAMTKAETRTGGNLEQKLRNEFGALELEINNGNPNRFTPDEIKLIKEVARGGGAQRLARYLGRVFYPNGPVSASASSIMTGGGAYLASGGDPALAGAAVLGGYALGAGGRRVAADMASESAQYTSAAIRNNALGSKYAGNALEISPVIKALPGIAGRTATTITLAEYQRANAN